MSGFCGKNSNNVKSRHARIGGARRAALVLLLLFAACFCCAAHSGGAQQVVFEADGKRFVYYDRTIAATDHTVSEEIQRKNINSPPEIKLRTVDRCLAAGASECEAIRYCYPLLVGFAEDLARQYECEPQDSTITFDPDIRPMFYITREKCGKKVDRRRLFRDIYIALRSGGKTIVKITADDVKPKVSAVDNIALTKLRSAFSTYYPSSTSNRKHNIELALSRVNGTVLLPGEEFSFNQKAGRRTEQNGYKKAKIIVGGNYTEGYGGGVCQSSTTVYNAALRAGMSITAVRSHSLLPAYVPPSFDAMVNSSGSDLRFINSADAPVFIRAYGDGTKATVEFYGKALDGRIDVKSVEISRGEVPADDEVVDVDRKHVQPETPAGERVRVSYGHPAIKSEGYVLEYDSSGRLVRTQKIRSDSYNKSRGIIAIAP